jgi:Aspartyl/Asparaginyl beta-hydroxylase
MLPPQPLLSLYLFVDTHLQLPTARTALFSRLGAGTRISSHRGWAELANHVLRCHLSLVVPTTPADTAAADTATAAADSTADTSSSSSNDSSSANSSSSCSDDGCCGLWVEGQRAIHRAGEIVVFDDSKLHKVSVATAFVQPLFACACSKHCISLCK